MYKGYIEIQKYWLRTLCCVNDLRQLFLYALTCWALIKFASLLYGAIGIYNVLKTLMEVPTWYLHTMWHTIPEGVSISTELVVFKQSPSLSLKSLVHFLNAHLITLLISLNVLFIISLSICFYHILKKPSPKPENSEWQGVWRGLEKTLERWTSSVSCDFTPEHLQDPDSLGRYLRQGCYGSGRYDEALIIWGLANDYRALFNTNPESESFWNWETESPNWKSVSPRW